MIPLVDLRAQYASIKGEIDAAIQSVVNDCQFYKGPHVERFEKAFGGIGVGNCTDALYLSLRALRIGAGDEVIVPAMTFAATAEAVTMAGANPVFVDMDPTTYCLDLDKAEAAITEQTAAIIPVHLFGRVVNMDRIDEMARKSGISIIEDCAQAAGAEWRGEPSWCWSDAACYSFYPTKNLGAYGDGGMVRVKDGYLGERIRMLADHGRREKFNHEMSGVCSRLDALQAAILSAKLPHLDEWNRQRYLAAIGLSVNLMDEKSIVLPDIPLDRREHVFHLFVVRLKNRDKIRAILAARGIETGLHYPIALPFTKAYAHLGHAPEDFPEAYAFSQECLSLPMYPELTLEQIRYIANSLKDAVRA
jgi:dTDP-4-amino-4,6-dideoxygalactose transaminase